VKYFHFSNWRAFNCAWLPGWLLGWLPDWHLWQPFTFGQNWQRSMWCAMKRPRIGSYRITWHGNMSSTISTTCNFVCPVATSQSADGQRYAPPKRESLTNGHNFNVQQMEPKIGVQRKNETTCSVSVSVSASTTL